MPRIAFVPLILDINKPIRADRQSAGDSTWKQMPNQVESQSRVVLVSEHYLSGMGRFRETSSVQELQPAPEVLASKTVHERSIEARD
jgi:hypothetical protein